jgi:hypothetical protein
MKMTKKANPMAFLSALLMVVAMWGCKMDREELISVSSPSQMTDPQRATTPAVAEPGEIFEIPWTSHLIASAPE